MAGGEGGTGASRAPLLLPLPCCCAVAETRSRQLELDKVAADFRALHAERQSLLRQWQEGLNTIQTRDADIAAAAGKFAALKQVRDGGGGAERLRPPLWQWMAPLLSPAPHPRPALLPPPPSERRRTARPHRRRSCLPGPRRDGELRDGSTPGGGAQGRRGAAGRAAGAPSGGEGRSLPSPHSPLCLASHRQSATDRVNSFRDDVDLLKAEVASAASERMQQRAANAVFAQQLADKERALEGAKRALEAMRSRLADAGSAAAMTEAGLGEQEAFMKAEQARATKAERELAVLKEALFKA